MDRGPDDLPQNELPEIEDKKPSFFKNNPDNLDVEGESLSNFLNQIVEIQQLNKVVDKLDSFKVEERIKSIDCKTQKAVLLFIVKRLLSDGDRIQLVNDHIILRDRVELTGLEKMADVVKELDEDDVEELLVYLVKHGKLNKYNKNSRLIDILNNE